MVRDLATRFCVVVLVLLSLAVVGVDDAQAQTSGCPANSVPTSGTGCGAQGAAYSACMAAAAAYTGAKSAACETVSGSGSWRLYSCTRSGSATGCNGVARFYYFPVDQLCSNQSPLAEGWFSVGSGPICKDGCAYGGESAPNVTTLTLFPGSPAAKAFRQEQGGFTPTGDVCTSSSGGGEPLTGEQCSTVGTLTQCMLPNGKHCAQASTGKKFCWNPNETGTKVSSNDGATKSPDGKPNNPPPIPPANNGNWEQNGSGSTTINNNGNSTTYNNNTYQSSNGSTGDGGGSTNPDGSEEPGDDGDGDKPNTVSGGGSCGEGSAPTCSGTSCTAEAFAILIQQWRSRCADEEARGQFDSDATSGAGDASGDDHGGMLANLWGAEAEAPSIDHNKVNIGGGLVIPTVTIFDQTWTAPPEFYDALGIIKFIVIASFTIAGLVVLWNR